MRRILYGALAVSLLSGAAMADGEVNIYSSRHYDTDDALYSDFEEQTGIKVNRIEDGADKLIERMRAEGELSSADIVLTVDVGRIQRADEAGLLQPIDSEAIADIVPDALHAANDHWVGVTTRARIIFYDKDDVTEPPQTYQELADPKYKGMICTRSSSNVYMQSLLASIIANDGEEAAREWAAGLLANLAREPEGGDTDQLRGLVSGECDIALSNHYYYARAFRQEVSGLTDSVDEIGYVFPNQETNGTHVNISAIGIAKHAPNADNARAFIEYLLTPSAQKLITSGSDEFPVLDEVAPSEAVDNLGDFKADQINLLDVAQQSTRAQEIYNEVGYK